ncbi:MAG: PepSY domain-containing protein [Beijerinckiaceae bacterium]
MKNPRIQATLLRLHRWITVILAIPLATLIVTGLVLSFAPIVQTTSIKPGSITLTELESHLARHDPQGTARGILMDHAAGTMTILGAEERKTVDIKSGVETDRRHWFSAWNRWARPLHEHFVYDLDWLVPLSTAAMLVSMFFGVLMGWPRIINTVGGWHKAAGWFLLPLLVLSPLTGLFITYGVTFTPPAQRAEALPVIEAVRLVAQKHDPSTLVYVRRRGPRQMALVNTGSEQIQYQPTKDGLKPLPANLPRIFHQGDFFGIWGGVMNVILSLAFVLLLTTGLWIWLKRTFFRKRRRVRQPAGRGAGAAQPAE